MIAALWADLLTSMRNLGREMPARIGSFCVSLVRNLPPLDVVDIDQAAAQLCGYDVFERHLCDEKATLPVTRGGHAPWFTKKRADLAWIWTS
jgi:hypothetical protein